jgi:hypothetical protein
MPLRVISWNPLYAGRERLEEILRVLSVDLLILPGSQVKAAPHRAVKQFFLGPRRVFEAGWLPAARRSNKSCGITLVLGNRLQTGKAISIQVPPREIAGRGLAVRIRTEHLDVLAIGAYFPPRAVGKKSGGYEECCRILMQWLTSI